MKKYTSLQFKTARQHGKAGIKRFTVLLLAILIFGGSASVLFFLKNYNFNIKNAFGTEQETESTTADSVPPAESADYHVLLFCAAKDRTRTDFLCLMHLSVPDNRVTLYSFSPSEQATVNGVTKTVGEFLTNGGEPALLQAVESYTGVLPDCYIGATEDEFKSVVDRYNGFDFTVTEQISYRGEDFTLILPKGVQNIRGDGLLKYFRYLLYHAENGIAAQGELVKVILEHFLVPERVEGMNDTYAYLANHLITDISIVRFAKASEGLAFLAQKGATYTVVKNTADYIAHS